MEKALESSKLHKAYTSPEELYATLGMRIRAMRLRRNMSRVELGTLTGLEANTIRRLEAGTFGTTLRRLNAVARALGVSESYLLESSDPKLLLDPDQELLREFRGHGLTDRELYSVIQYANFIRTRSNLYAEQPIGTKETHVETWRHEDKTPDAATGVR